MRKSGLLVPFFFLQIGVVALAVACGDDDSTPTTGSPDASTTSDGSSGGGDTGTTSSSGDTGASSGTDTGPTVIPIRCTDTELAANSVTDGGGIEVTFPTNETPAQYTNRCSTIKVGAKVTFTGKLESHPLEPAGGDKPTPIVLTQAGTTITVTFTAAGTYGFQCQFHPSVMFGAVKVVP